MGFVVWFACGLLGSVMLRGKWAKDFPDDGPFWSMSPLWYMLFFFMSWGGCLWLLSSICSLLVMSLDGTEWFFQPICKKDSRK